MVKKTEIGWRIVENSLSRRMIDDSLIHLFDEGQKPISERTQIINKELARFHTIKDYDQYVKLKTKALRKFDGLDVSDSSDDEKKIYTRRTNTVRKKNVQKNPEKKKSKEKTAISKCKISLKRSNRQTKTTNKSDNILQNNKSDVDLTDVNNSVLSFSSNIEHNSLIVNHSIKNSLNEDSSINEHPTVNLIDKDKKIDEDRTKDPSVKDHTLKDLSVENQNIEGPIIRDPSVVQNVEDQTIQDPLFENQNIENYAVEDPSDENQNIEDLTDKVQDIEDNLIEDLIDERQYIDVNKSMEASPKSDNNELVENDTSAIFQSQKSDSMIQKDKPVLKITSTEVVKPKYTIITDSQSTIDVMNNSWKNQESESEELFDDDSDDNNENIAFRKINRTKIITGEETINKDSISLINRICNSSSENEELEPSLQSILSCTDWVNNHTKASINSIRKDKENSYVLDEAYYDENVIEEVMEANKIDNVLTCSAANERKALEYILKHVSYLRNPEKQHLFDMQYLNESFVHLRKEYADDSSSQSEISHKRPPTTLDEFVQVNNLVPMENKPSTITLDDLSDNDEFFVMEIPKSVIDQQQFIGTKMEIKKKSVIIGDTKYKLQRKKNKSLTCIFRENNKNMSFKAVNIEPIGSFVVRQRLPSRIMKSCSPKIANNTNTRAPFPKNLKTRNPLENNNEKLTRYKEKIMNDHENIYRKRKLKLEK